MANKTEMAKKKEEIIKGSLVNIELYSINGQQLKYDTTSNELSLERSNYLDLYEIRGNIVKVRLSEKLFFKPEGLFKLDFEVIGTFEFNKEVKKEEIQEQLDSLATPLLSYSSMIIALMTERFTNVPFILPPEKAD
ncbi:MAG: hypothetical protein GX050_06880 [Firmicutes bacterium]|nr:hypothetical protein [Bacillota bacterium]